MTALLAAAECGGGPLGAADIQDQAPQGLMEGEPWTAVEASVHRDVPGSGAEDTFTISPFAEDLDECSFSHPSGTSQVLFTMPAAPGEHPLHSDLSDLESTEVAIDVLAMAGGHEINGRIRATICP